MAEPPSTLSEYHEQGLLSVFQSGEHSDLEVTCGHYTFKVHKVILTSQSEWFQKACKLDGFKESFTGSIHLKATSDSDADSHDVSCDDPDAVAAMMDSFYQQDYRIDRITCWDDMVDDKRHMMFGAKDCAIVGHAKIFITAIKYQFPGLKNLAAAHFADAVKDVAFRGMKDDLIEAIHYIYKDEMPNEIKILREAVVEALWLYPELRQSPDFQAAAKVQHTLCYDLVAANNEPKIDKAAEEIDTDNIRKMMRRKGYPRAISVVSKDKYGNIMCSLCKARILSARVEDALTPCSRCGQVQAICDLCAERHEEIDEPVLCGACPWGA